MQNQPIPSAGSFYKRFDVRSTSTNSTYNQPDNKPIILKENESSDGQEDCNQVTPPGRPSFPFQETDTLLVD